MEKNSKNSTREKLYSQIKSSHGKVVYSHTTHEKEIQRLQKINDRIKLAQIILSAVSAGSIVTVFFGQSVWTEIIASVFSFLLLILNLITLKFDISSNISKHVDSTNKLWLIREEYLSLITDFEFLSTEEIMTKRDYLTKKTGEVYSGSPKTSNKSYKKAQKAIKEEEEQYFSDEELNYLLPPNHRNKNKDVM